MTFTESRLRASLRVHRHFIIVRTFCQLTQLQNFLLDNFSLKTDHVKNLHANKEDFTVHYGGRDKHNRSSIVKASFSLGRSSMQGPQGIFGLWSTSA